MTKHRVYYVSELGYEPEYKTEGAVGADIRSVETKVIQRGYATSIQTDLRVQIPEGLEGQVRMRSGLAKEGLMLLNGVATIDSDYRGKIQILVTSVGREPFYIKKGDRIAQLVIAPIERVIFVKRDYLDETERGDSGFGSTGIK